MNLLSWGRSTLHRNGGDDVVQMGQTITSEERQKWHQDKADGMNISHCTAVVLSKNTAHNRQAMGAGVNPLQRSQSQRFTPLKTPGSPRHL